MFGPKLEIMKIKGVNCIMESLTLFEFFKSKLFLVFICLDMNYQPNIEKLKFHMLSFLNLVFSYIGCLQNKSAIPDFKSCMEPVI